MKPDEPSGRCFVTGPYRLIRFPQWSGDLLFFGSLLAATANWAAVFSFLVAWFLLGFVHLPHAEQAWKRLLGDDYDDYERRTGSVLPRLRGNVTGPESQYAVPKRFSLSAVIALVTMYAVMFGFINLLQSQLSEFEPSPILHLFFGVQLMAIWIGQMRFEKSPRLISVVVGAFLLPLFVFFQNKNVPMSSFLTLVYFILFIFGAIIGYCLGAIAAGLFLVMDRLGPYLPGTRPSTSTPGKL
jgi:protein-S-isoprenylcysteine O-methyltransferase Ste14